MRDYQLISPSLDGILHHDSIVYEGINRPFELLRVMDRSSVAQKKKSSFKEEIVYTNQEYKIIEQYAQDLQNLFIKKFSQFMIEVDTKSEEGVKLQALLQELIKIKKINTKQFKIK